MNWNVTDLISIEEHKPGLLHIKFGDGLDTISKDDIKPMIDTLKRIQAYYVAKELAEAEAEKLERWGKAKIPCGE